MVLQAYVSQAFFAVYTSQLVWGVHASVASASSETRSWSGLDSASPHFFLEVCVCVCCLLNRENTVENQCGSIDSNGGSLRKAVGNLIISSPSRCMRQGHPELLRIGMHAYARS